MLIPSPVTPMVANSPLASLEQEAWTYGSFEVILVETSCFDNATASPKVAIAGEGGSKTWTMTLSTDEARMAYFEKDENFRWIANMFAPVCPTRLSKCVPENIQQAVYAFAEFAEIAHGSIDPEWILRKENRLLLGEPGLPLERYPVLAGRRKDRQLVEDIKLVSVFHGEKGTLQGYCAIRMAPQTPAQAAPSQGPFSDVAGHVTDAELSRGYTASTDTHLFGYIQPATGDVRCADHTCRLSH